MSKITTETQEEYRQRVMELVCNEIANSDKSLEVICGGIPDAPTGRTISRWLVDDDSLCQVYARAKERQADYLAAQILELSDQCRMGTRTTDRDGKIEIVTADMVERSRLQIDARKWLAAKLAPRKYGDRVQVETSTTLTIAPVDLSAWANVIDVTPLPVEN